MTTQDPQHNSPHGPTQPPPWPHPYAGHSYTPYPPQKPSRTPLIVAAVIIAVGLIVSGTLIATWTPDPSSSTTAQQTTSTTAAPTLVRVIPATLLPTADQVRAATLIDVHYVGKPITTVHTDAETTPPGCAVAAAAASQSSWGTAISTVIQKYGDGPDEDQSINFAGVGVGIFDTPAEAAASFTTVSDSVRGCTSYTRPKAGGGTSAWTVGDVQAHDGRLLWTDTDTGSASQWKCAKAYLSHANLTTFTVVCSSNPADSAARLADQIIANATKK